MKRYIILAVTLGVVLTSGITARADCPTHRAAELKKAAMRQEVIDNVPKNYMSTPAEDAMLLRILIQTRDAKRGIEVGTAVGFGTVNMGIAFERTGGHLYGLEIDEKMVTETRKNVSKAGLDESVTIIHGDALEELPKLDSKFDFMYIDALKTDYLKYFQAVEDKLLPGAVVVGHNAINEGKHMQDWLGYMKDHADWEMVIVTGGKNRGMAVCYKVR